MTCESVGTADIALAHAIVLIDELDRRILPALRFVTRLPGLSARAVHIATDMEAARALALDWMDVGLDWLPLTIREPVGGSLETSVDAVVREEVRQHGATTVVIPELHFALWWHPLLHRGGGRRIIRQLHPIPGVTTVLVPYPVP